jgi:hypothetical protein
MLMRTPHRWVRPKRQLRPGFIVPCQPTLAAKVPGERATFSETHQEPVTKGADTDQAHSDF